MAEIKSVKLTTPRGTAIWPRLNTPDTKYNSAGKFEAKIAIVVDELSPSDAAAFEKLQAKVQELTDAKFDEIVEGLKAEGKDAVAKKVTKVYNMKPEEDDKTGEETGRILLKASMTASGISKKTNKPWSRKPDLFDGQGKQLKNPPAVGGGSILKLSVELFPYYAAKEKEVGVSFRLEGAQIIKLVSFGERDASAHGFGAEEDGDEIEDRAASDFGADAASGDEGDDEL